MANKAVMARDRLMAYLTDSGVDPATVNEMAVVADVALSLVAELGAEFNDRLPTFMTLDDYYRGVPPMPGSPDRLTEKYKELHQMSRSNWLALVVDVVNERLRIGSIASTGNPVQDKVAWNWWRANNMDGTSSQVHAAALKYGLCYVSVWPTGDVKRPLMMGESPLTCYVRYHHESGMATAALRVWQDGPCQRIYADLTLPGYQFHLVSDSECSSTTIAMSEVSPNRHIVTVDLSEVDWRFREDVLPVERNPLGEVPYVKMLTEPDLVGGYRSEIEGLTSTQDRISKTNFDRLMAQAFASFPRAWITGIDVPTDPKSGKPKEPFDAAVDRLWTIENEIPPNLRATSRPTPPTCRRWPRSRARRHITYWPA